MFNIFRLQGGKPKNYFAIQKALLKLVGIDLDIGANKFRYLVFAVYLIISYSCIELMELLAHLDDFDVVTNITLHLIGFSVGVMKCFVLFYNREKIKLILKAIETDGLTLDKEGFAEQLIKRCILQSNVQTVYCMVPLYLVFIGSEITTLIRRVLFKTSKLPFTQLTVIDVTSNVYYLAMWLHQTIVYALAADAYLSAEVLVTAILGHVYIQCQIIKNFIKEKPLTRNFLKPSATNINHVGYNIKKISFPNRSYPRQDRLRQIVIHHANIYDLAKQIQEAFQMVLLIMLASDVLIICFSAFHASLFPLNDIQCLRDIGIALSIIMKDLIICYWGNEVCLESQTIATDSYKSDNFEGDISFQKGLLLVMLRSQKPIIITAGKFAPLSLNTFIWIVRTSYSYFTVLRSRNV